MTGRDDARGAELLDEYWNRLRIDATTPAPDEIDPGTTELVRALDHLRPDNPDGAFVSRLRARLIPASEQPVGALPATSGTIPRERIEQMPAVDEPRRSRGREVLQMAAAMLGIAIVGTLLVVLFRDTDRAGGPEDEPIQPAGEPASPTSEPVVAPPAEPIYQIAYSSYEEDGSGKLMMLADGLTGATTPLTSANDAVYVGMANWSPDGRYLAYVGPSGETGIVIHDVTSGATRALAATMGAFRPQWSPDGTSIVYMASGADGMMDLFLIDVDGGEPLNLTDSPGQELAPVWSPDGSLIAFCWDGEGSNDVYIIDRDGGNLRNVSNLPGDEFQPSWSPDSTRIAFNTHPNGNADIFVATLATGEVTNITNSPDNEVYAVWSPVDDTIAFTRSAADDTAGRTNLWLMDADGGNQRQLGYDDAYASIYAAWSPDGSRIAATLQLFGQQDSVAWTLLVIDRDGRENHWISDHAAELDAPVWRPGATDEVQTAQPRPEPTPTILMEPTPDPTIANDRSGDLLAPLNIGGGQIRLFVIPANGAPIYQLLPEGTVEGNQVAGVWSPDGRQVALTTQVDSARDIYVVNADGSNLLQLAPVELSEPLPDHWVISQESPAWSPDGTTIAFASNRAIDEGGQDLYLINADGSDLRRMTDDEIWEYGPRWSPDGSQIAFEAISASRGDYGSIYIMNADGSDRRQLVELIGARDPNWSPDGEWIAFSAGRFGSTLNIVRPDGSDGRGISVNSTNARWPRWSPDGSTLAWSAHDDGGSFDGIGVYDMSTGDTRLIHGIAGVIEWSPDGQWMAVAMPEFDLTGVPTGNGGLYLVAPDGSNQFRLLALPIDEFDIMLDWRVAN